MERLLVELSALSHTQIDLVVIALLLQGAVFTVVPEEAVITALGVLVARHRLSFIEAMLAVQIGLLPANACLFWVGRKFGRAILRLKPVSVLVGRAAVARAQLAFRRSGAWIIAVTRFTPLIRGPIYLAAGLSKLRFSRFAALDASASLLQIPLLLVVGYFVGKSSGGILDAYRKIALGTALVLAAAVLTKVATSSARASARLTIDARREV